MNTQNGEADYSSASYVLDQCLSFMYSAALRTAAELRVADSLADGPKSAEDLAESTGTNPGYLYRILRYLATRGIFHEGGDGRFHLTPAAETLRSDASPSMRAGVLMLTDRTFWQPAGNLVKTVREGKTCFDEIFGSSFWDALNQDKELGDTFHVGMASMSDSENQLITQSYDFSDVSTVVDVGGGRGGFLSEILKSAPNCRGILFDEEVVAKDHHLDEDDLTGRFEIASGDFFQEVPGGGDAYVLKRILHDWDDAQSLRILKNCRAAMQPSGRVLVVDAAIPSGNDPHTGKILDILMMTSFNGRERSESDFQELFGKAGFNLSRIISTPSSLSIVEGRPV